jgi:integrase
MTGMRRAVEDYLALRRSLGFKLVQPGQLLADFAAFRDKAGARHVTSELALQWATAPTGVRPGWHRQRLAVVRDFATYLHAMDPGHQVPPEGLLVGRYDRPIPYLFTTKDITALVRAAGALGGPFHTATYQTFIGLVAVTGMRPGEAIRLGRDDLDPAAGLLTVVDSKYGKSRQLLLHPSTVRALTVYASLRDRHCPRPESPSFLLSARGTRLWRADVDKGFRDLARQIGLRPRSVRCRPCPMGLRHSFAVNMLIDWYRAGVDIDARLPALSTWLGHADPKNTYWYLQSCPELMALAAERMRQARSRKEP